MAKTRTTPRFSVPRQLFTGSHLTDDHTTAPREIDRHEDVEAEEEDIVEWNDADNLNSLEDEEEDVVERNDEDDLNSLDSEIAEGNSGVSERKEDEDVKDEVEEDDIVDKNVEDNLHEEGKSGVSEEKEQEDVKFEEDNDVAKEGDYPNALEVVCHKNGQDEGKISERKGCHSGGEGGNHKKKTKRTKDEAQKLLLNEPDDDSAFNDIMFDGTAEDPIVLE